MENKPSNKFTRKRFLQWTTASLAAIGLFKFWKSSGRKNWHVNRYLTEDGQLVEVRKEHAKSQGIKIDNLQLKNWIKK